MNFLELYNQTNSKLFLIGESHGSKEMPKAFISILNETLALNKHINLFLEFPSDMQELLNDYVQNKVSYKEFLKTKFYSHPKNLYDGRTSKDMFNIINFAKENKDKISTYFVVGGNTSSSDEYERAMCENIYKRYDENKLNFYYTGSIHAITKIVPNIFLSNIFEKNNYLPCGIHIKNKISNVVSIELAPYSGKFLSLVCISNDPNSRRLKYTKQKGASRVKRIYNEFIKLEEEMFDYRYCIKRVTPSYKLR